jgi:hypothetical protein
MHVARTGSPAKVHARDHVWGVHPASVLLFVCYGFGLHLLAHVEDQPIWSPAQTRHAQDEAEQAQATGTDERATVRSGGCSTPRSPPRPATWWARRHPPWSS